LAFVKLIAQHVNAHGAACTSEQQGEELPMFTLFIFLLASEKLEVTQPSQSKTLYIQKCLPNYSA
jgi:hypothetical protein